MRKSSSRLARALDPARVLCFVALASALVGCATLAFAQAGTLDEAARRPPAQPTGTCRITGRVVAADNGAPVRRGQVTLSGLQLTVRSATPPRDAVSVGLAYIGSPSSKQAETGQDGEFQFADLPAGQYRLSVSPPPGFLAPQMSESVSLVEGQPASVTLRLERSGVITGRVLDEFGDPLMRVGVRAIRRDSTTGGRSTTAGMGGYSTTDDLGHFRLYGLPPGEYYVEGTYQGFQGLRGNERRTGYGPTYYPGSAGLQEARRVTVRSGQETAAIEFTMLRVPLARVLGLATDSTGRPFANQPGLGGSVSIATRDEPGSNRGSGVRPDGTFEINDVTPGEYYLVASFTRGQGQDAEREAAYVPFTANGADVTINIQTNKGAVLSGRVIFEGPEPPVPASMTTSSPTTGMRTMIASRPGPDAPEGLSWSSTRPVQVADDGTFELTGVRGSVFLAATSSRGILKSVLRGGQDVTAKPMTFQGTERVTDLVVVLTSEVATIEGDVTDGRSQPAAGATVVLFPDDADRWFANSPFVVVTRALPEVPMRPGPITAPPGMPAGPPWTPVIGGFRATRLLPGRYWAIALPPRNNMMSTFDRDGLEKLRASATSVTLTAGETATVHLRIAQ